jgi:hypothetical protein
MEFKCPGLGTSNGVSGLSMDNIVPGNREKASPFFTMGASQNLGEKIKRAKGKHK